MNVMLNKEYLVAPVTILSTIQVREEPYLRFVSV